MALQQDQQAKDDVRQQHQDVKRDVEEEGIVIKETSLPDGLGSCRDVEDSSKGADCRNEPAFSPQRSRADQEDAHNRTNDNKDTEVGEQGEHKYTPSTDCHMQRSGQQICNGYGGGADDLSRLFSKIKRSGLVLTTTSLLSGKGEQKAVQKVEPESTHAEIRGARARKGSEFTRDPKWASNNLIVDSPRPTSNGTTTSSASLQSSRSSSACFRSAKELSSTPNNAVHPGTETEAQPHQDITRHNPDDPTAIDRPDAQPTRANNRLSKSSSRCSYNTFGTANSYKSSSSNSSSHRNNSRYHLNQETARTWRGLFASVRRLSHSTSTTGSSTYSSASSISSSSSSEENARHRNRRVRRTLKKPIPALLSSQGTCDRSIVAKNKTPRRLSIAVVGDGAVGKSALTLRFLRDQFHDEYDPTIEDSYCRHIKVDGQEYTLDINDTAGQQEYRGHWNDRFLRKGDGFICVYSVASMSSFAELAVLRDQIWRAKESSQVPMIVVGNKWDLVDQGDRQVSTDVGARFAEESKALFVETSAKTGLHVDEMFIELVRNIVRARQSDRQGGSACEPSVSEKIQPKLAKEQSRTKSPSGSRSKEWDSGGKKNHRCCTIM